jgi:hypothetical protein
MRTLVVAAALLGMIASLQAKEADSLRGMQNSIDAAKQFVSNQSGSPRGKPTRTTPDSRKDRDFSPEVIVPDI